MLRAALWPVLERDVFAAETTPTLFNFYRDEDPALDQVGAAAQRRAHLAAYLDAFDVPGPARPDVLLLAEAPGPHGTRFSGIPLAAEAFLVDPAYPVAGRPTSREAERTGRPLGEYSSGIVRRTLAPYPGRVFIWSTVPLHPHPAGQPRKIRTPTRAEAERFAPVVEAVAAAVQPRLVLAVGRVAERTLAALGIGARYVRHPSQGGARLFADGVRAALDALSPTPSP